MLFLCWLIVLSLGWEVVRTASRAGRSSGRGFFGALSRMLTMQNRRYGGYVVHVGLAMLGVAVTISAMYRVQTEVTLAKGERVEISSGRQKYEMELRGVVIERAKQGQAYDSARTQVVLYRDGQEVASLAPEARYWPVTPFRPDDPRATTEVEIARLPAQDLYVFFERPGLDMSQGMPGAPWWDMQKFRFSVFRNPFMWLLWAGWITMLVGGAFAALPLGGRRVGLAD
jgi:cytochrome c-type biogenesis protein CcmF